VDDRNLTALCYALYWGKDESCESADILINAGALDDLQYPFECIGNSRTSVEHIKLLTRHGMDPNLANLTGATPILEFAYRGDTEAVKTLVGSGARINTTALDGRTPLTEAVRQGHLDVIQYLIGLGADTSTRMEGKSLLDIARAQKEKRAVGTAPYLRYEAVIEFLEKHELGDVG